MCTDFQYDSSNSGNPIVVNQLPPIVQVTMVVISEASAQRVDTLSLTPPPDIEAALSGSGGAPFTASNLAQYTADLKTLSTALASRHITFQVFTTSIPLKESKWSNKSQ